MAKHCINVKSPEFKQLVEESKINPLELAAKISLWQDANNTDEFPSVSEVKRFGEVQYQKQTASDEGIIASEKTIRDLAARMSDRIGIQYKIISDRSQVYKGKIEDNTTVINLAYATLDTAVHEVLGHSIIRALKNKSNLSSKEQLTQQVEQGNIEKKC